MCEKKTRPDKMSNIGIQQSTLCYNLNQYKNKTKNMSTKKHKKAYRLSTAAKVKDKNATIHRNSTTQ